MSNLTFGIIKPDAVKKGVHGAIIQRVFRQWIQHSRDETYSSNKETSNGFFMRYTLTDRFFGELTEFMSSGPCVVLALEKENAVSEWRDLMGVTDPAEADEGTLRKEFASSIGENAVHGSDSDENAVIETAYFFSKLELV